MNQNPPLLSSFLIFQVFAQPCMIVFHFCLIILIRVINFKISIAQPLVKTYHNYLRFQYGPVEYVHAHPTEGFLGFNIFSTPLRISVYLQLILSIIYL